MGGVADEKVETNSRDKPHVTLHENMIKIYLKNEGDNKQTSVY